METQLTIPFSIHTRENNDKSQENLERKRLSLTSKCMIVLKVMLKGNEVWSDVAETRCFDEEGNRVLIGTGVKISSFPRRIKDLKDNVGLGQWLEYRDDEDGYRHWFIRKENHDKVREYLFNKATVKAA